MKAMFPLEELSKNSTMVFLKDYWQVLAGLVAVAFVTIKTVQRVFARINKIDTIENDVGTLKTDVKALKTDVTALKIDTSYVKGKIDAIEKLLRNFAKTSKSLVNAHSPVVLRDEFKPLVHDSGMGKEIETKKPQLVEWLKSKNPPTGLDAQDMVYDLVLSDELNNFIPIEAVNKFKQHLYIKGRTSEEFYGILSAYLYEALIPELNFPGDNKDTKD